MTKTLFMETTKISTAKTVGQIHELLSRCGARSIMTEYDRDAHEVTAVSFGVVVNGQEIAFRLPCRWAAVLETQMVRAEEIFLPYALVDKGTTLFEKIEAQQFKLLESKGE